MQELRNDALGGLQTLLHIDERLLATNLTQRLQHLIPTTPLQFVTVVLQQPQQTTEDDLFQLR